MYAALDVWFLWSWAICRDTIVPIGFAYANLSGY